MAALGFDLDVVVIESSIALEGLCDTRRDLGCRGSWLLDGDLVVKTLHSPDPRDIFLGCVFLVVPIDVASQSDVAIHNTDGDPLIGDLIIEGKRASKCPLQYPDRRKPLVQGD